MGKAGSLERPETKIMKRTLSSSDMLLSRMSHSQMTMGCEGSRSLYRATRLRAATEMVGIPHTSISSDDDGISSKMGRGTIEARPTRTQVAAPLISCEHT